MSKQSDQWQKLMVAAQSGDAASYRRLLTEIAPFAKRVILKSINMPDFADDIVQEVLLSVHKAMNTYDPSRPFMPWLLAIINFRRLDYLRKHYASRDNVTSTIDSLEEVADVTFDVYRDEYKDIEEAVQMLAPRQKMIFDLVKLKGYSAKEVAEKTGMSVSAVKVSVFRSMQKLRELLG